MPEANEGSSTNSPSVSSGVSTTVPNATVTSTTATGTGGKADTAEETPDWKTEAEKWKELARKHEDRAKANANAAKELEQLRQQSMSDQEKAVAEAKAEGRAEAMAAAMGKLAAAEIRAAAAARLSAEQLEVLIEATNLAVFVGEDGEIDRDKIQRFVDGIAPLPTEETAPPGFPDLGQGARGGSSSVGLGSDPLLRDLKSMLGIR